jgi:4-oxalocrotonate tautomerase
MPIITIAARPLPDVEKKATLVRKVTEAACEAYGMPPESITVLIQEYPKEDIGVAGCLVSEREKTAGA